MAETARFLAEAKLLMDGGSKAAAAFLTAAVVWWFANLFPLNFSGRDDGTPSGRIDALITKADAAFDSCSGADSSLRGSFGRKATNACTIEGGTRDSGEKPRAVSSILADDDNEARPLVRMSGPELEQRIGSLQRELEKLASREGDKAVTRDGRQCGVHVASALAKLDACSRDKKAYASASDEYAKAGGFDVAGLKIKEIHPRLHPLLLAFILLCGAAWIGARRRRVFALLDRHFHTVGSAANSVPADPPGPVFISIPWWLWPLPLWKAPCGTDFGARVAEAEERRRCMGQALSIAALLAAMAVTALTVQRGLSDESIARRVAADGNVAFSFAGHFVADLAFLGALLGFGCVLYARTGRPHDKPPSSAYERRVLLRQGLLFGAAGIGGALTAPLAIDSAGAMRAIDSEGRRVTQWNPRARSRPTFTSHPGPPGLYVPLPSDVAGRGASTSDPIKEAAVLFVRPGLESKRTEKLRERPKKPKKKQVVRGLAFRLRSWLKPATKTIRRQPDTIRGKIASTPTVPWKPGRFDAQRQAASGPWRLNKKFYSEGIEYAALQLWSQSKHQEAIDVLMAGIKHGEEIPNEPLNIRLYDLAAGLLAHTGRLGDLEALREHLARQPPGRAAFKNPNGPRITSRLAAWRDPGGRWRNKWSPAAERHWNGVRI